MSGSDEYQMLPSEIDSMTEHQRSMMKQPHHQQQQQQSHSSSSFLPSSLSLLLGSKSVESSNSPSSHSNVLIRTVRSITDECCKSPCTLSQLKAYCGERKRSAPSSISYTGTMLLPFMSGQSTSPGQYKEYAEWDKTKQNKTIPKTSEPWRNWNYQLQVYKMVNALPEMPSPYKLFQWKKYPRIVSIEIWIKVSQNQLIQDTGPHLPNELNLCIHMLVTHLFFSFCVCFLSFFSFTFSLSLSLSFHSLSLSLSRF